MCAFLSRLSIKYHQLTQTVKYDFWLNKHQRKKSKKHSQWWAVEPDQFFWGARAKMTVIKSSKQSL